MKKIALVLAIALSSAAGFAQINKGELKQLQNFLSQPGKEAPTNAEALRISNVKDPSTWEGITIVGNHVTKIDWKDKKIAGTLDLSGFSELTSVDVSRNALTALSVKGAAALNDLNASRNKLNEINLDGATSLVKLSLNNNRITEFSLTGAPVIKSINIASNLSLRST